MKAKHSFSPRPATQWLQATVCCLLISALCLPVFAQSTAFTYQGRLDDGATPASGNYDLRFTLFNAVTAGTQQGALLTNTPTPVSNGLFTVTLDFGNQFPGADRWLEIAVRTNGGGAFSTLAPRQALTPTPYAIFAGKVNASGISGALAPGNIANGTITTLMLANGAVGSNQLAAGAVTTPALANGAVTANKVATVTNWFALTIPNPTPVADDNFGNALAALGSDRVLIGAERDDTGATNAGAAYLFSTNGTLLTAFTNPTPTSFDGFGISVAGVGSDRVLIGAYGDDTGATNAGAAYLFSTNGTLLTTFTNPTPAISDLFGYALAVVGNDQMLIGAVNDDTDAVNSGAAYLFSTNGTLLTTFTNPTPANGDLFGYALAAVGNDRVLIGAYADNMGAFDDGVAYLFSTNGALLTTFTNPTPAAFDSFGNSVAAVGSDQVLIGAYGDDTGAPDTGAAYLFSTNGTLLTTFTNPAPASSDLFGYSLAVVGGDRVLISSVNDDLGEQDAGAAYLFSTETFTDGLVADAVRARSVTTASLEDGAVTAAKISGVLLPSQIPNIYSAGAGVSLVGNQFSLVFAPNGTAASVARGDHTHSANEITLGTLGDSILSANVALLNRSPQTFTGTNNFTQRVGIGTASPVADLHVNGPVVIQGPAVVPGNTSSSNLLNLMVGGGSSAVATNGSLNGISFYESAGAAAMSLGYDGSGNSALNALRIYNSSGSPLFTFEASGQIGIGTSSPSENLHVVGNILATGTITPSSDRNVKKNFSPVDTLAVLEKVNALPIQQWTYQAEADAVRHVGPMAQDFHAAFGLGANDVTIATVDADGVALAAIQGLNQKVEARSQKSEDRMQSLETENAELKLRLEKLEQLMNHKLNGGAK